MEIRKLPNVSTFTDQSDKYSQKKINYSDISQTDLTVKGHAKNVFEMGVELSGSSTDAIKGKNIKLEYDSGCK